EDFVALGLDPARHDLTVVKVGYLVPELFAAAKGWVIALTPGGVDQDIVRLGHRALDRPIYPLDPDMPAPDLRPERLGPRPSPGGPYPPISPRGRGPRRGGARGAPRARRPRPAATRARCARRPDRSPIREGAR